MSAADARKIFEDLQASIQFDYFGINESEKTILADVLTVKLNILRPKNINDVLLVFIFVLGDGWIIGDCQTHKRMFRDIEAGFGALGPL